MGECKVYTKTLTVSTRGKFEVLNITRRVEEVVRASGIRNGFVLVFTPHATAAIVANEFEPRIAQDYVDWVKQVFKPGGGWLHDTIDDNAHAHLASAFIGAGKVFPLVNGELIRGTWQEVLLLEFDGPRHSRRVVIQVVGT